MDVKGKTYWLVGASEGLGAEVAVKLAEAGAHLVLSARRQEALDKVSSRLAGSGHSTMTLDVTDAQSIEEAARQIGDIDGVVYLVGAYEPMNSKDVEIDRVAFMMEANYTGAVRVVSAVLPQMLTRDAGHIVLTGSLAAYRGLPAAVGYANSKAALFSYAEGLKIDLKATGIDTQIINPGFIETRLTEKNDFEMTQIMKPDEAAAHFVKAMFSGAFAVAFPRPFSLFFRLAPLMPNWLYYRFFKG